MGGWGRLGRRAGRPATEMQNKSGRPQEFVQQRIEVIGRSPRLFSFVATRRGDRPLKNGFAPARNHGLGAIRTSCAFSATKRPNVDRREGC